MTKSKANCHVIVAIAAVVGAEFEGLKNETMAQLEAHTPVFWLCMVCAIIVAAYNQLISTKPSSDGAQSDSPPATTTTAAPKSP